MGFDLVPEAGPDLTYIGTDGVGQRRSAHIVPSTSQPVLMFHVFSCEEIHGVSPVLRRNPVWTPHLLWTHPLFAH